MLCKNYLTFIIDKVFLQLVIANSTQKVFINSMYFNVLMPIIHLLTFDRCSIFQNAEM